MKPVIIDLTGRRFGRWLVLNRSLNRNNTVYYLCKYDCGREKSIQAGALRNGLSQSCGCLHSEKASIRHTKHGLEYTRLYRIWRNMLERCNNLTNPISKNYGARGITVCERWYDIKNFLEDMGHPPKDLTLERIDNDKGYYKENCKWATRLEQAQNKRPLTKRTEPFTA